MKGYGMAWEGVKGKRITWYVRTDQDSKGIGMNMREGRRARKEAERNREKIQ